MRSAETGAAPASLDGLAAQPGAGTTARADSSAVPAISLQSVVKRYGRFEALRGVSLDIDQGEFFGLLGPNGAGKTSLISIIAGLSRPDSGAARVMGHDVVTDFRGARRLLGVVPQELVFDPFFTVRETLRLTSGYYGVRDNDPWIDEILDNLDLADKANANMRALSGGMKRRVLVAQALVHRPPVILLDEPTAGVDVELRRTLWAFIRRLNRDGHTIVLTTHYLEEAQELCGRIAMLKAGQIVALARTSELLGRFSGGRLSLKLSGAAMPTGLDSLRIDDGVDDRIVLRVDAPDSLESVLRALREAGCRIDEIDFERTDLEDVFLRIIREAA
jgi:ABC-2 type transport system ATP-binding protein